MSGATKMAGVVTIMTHAEERVSALYSWFHEAASSTACGRALDSEGIVNGLAILRDIECDVDETKQTAAGATS